ncbi:dTDP-4-dehydrorhamnose reductase [Gammaproteobacteria bacterium AS21]
MKIIVIGRSGQLAWELARLTTEKHQMVCLGRDDIDLKCQANIITTLVKYEAEAVINAAAYTAVDLAESDSDSAYNLNEGAVGLLAIVCKELSLHLIQISTDFVFDGNKSTPYFPNDTVNPMSVYGASKAAGEQVLLKLLPDASCIIRTSWVYSIHGNNFVKTMLCLMAEKSELGIISDQIGSPTSAKSLAQACLYAALHRVKGIHHWTDAGVASWYDFAIAIQELALKRNILSVPIIINPISTSQYPTPAKRPSYSVLDKTSLVEHFSGVLNRHWQVELNEMLDELSSSSVN